MPAKALQLLYCELVATLNKVPVQWTGVQGLPGVSVFWTVSTVDITVPLATFFNAIKGSFPSSVNWTIPSQGDAFDSGSGALVGSWSGGTGATIAGTNATQNHPAGVGARVQWNTNVIVNRRRLRGATYLTELSTGSFDPDGTLLAATLTTFRAAATAFATGSAPVIWHRPHKGASDGAYGTATSATIPDRVTALRSRRF